MLSICKPDKGGLSVGKSVAQKWNKLTPLCCGSLCKSHGLQVSLIKLLRQRVTQCLSNLCLHSEGHQFKAHGYWSDFTIRLLSRASVAPGTKWLHFFQLYITPSSEQIYTDEMHTPVCTSVYYVSTSDTQLEPNYTVRRYCHPIPKFHFHEEFHVHNHPEKNNSILKDLFSLLKKITLQILPSGAFIQLYQ